MSDERDEAGGKLKATPLRLATQDGRLLKDQPRHEGGGGGDPPGDPPSGGGGGGSPEELPTFASEEAMANVLIHTRLNGDWRYGSDGRWYHFDGRRWGVDERLAVFHLARMVCRTTSANAALTVSVKRQVSSGKSIAAVERIARSDPDIATPMEMFDRDPWSLNTPDGIVELRTGELLPHDRNRLCTRLTGASPSPMHQCHQWRRFLKEITGGDHVFEDYLQRLVGYSLMGITPEEIFVFIYGPSNTGKSKFVEVLRMLHGDYGAGAPMDTFEAAQGLRHPTDLAGFVGRRLVTAAETEEGRRWDQQRLTMLTGRDRVQARFVNKNFFEYTPQFLLVFHGNYRPRLGGVSDAMRRRLHLIPFRFKPIRLDKHLIDKLRAELPGIMAWAIEGCLNWQREGLIPPPIVTAATDDYFKFEDIISEWLDERCDLGATLYASSRELHRDFSVWMQGRGFIPNESVFVSRLESIDGLRRSARLPNNRRGFWGIALKRRQGDLPLDGEPPTPPHKPTLI